MIDGTGSDAGVRTRATTVCVPATSANLGPGFDTLGLALGLCDEITVEASFPAEPTPAEPTPAGPTPAEPAPAGTPLSTAAVTILGEGTDSLETDEGHLVVRTMRRVFDELGEPQPHSLELTCTNRIPHGRGLGSSAAAIVGGVVAARALVRDGPARLPDGPALALAAELEGHPDNVAACLLGGLTLAWSEWEHDRERARAVRLEPAEIDILAFVPDTELATLAARGLLPATVSHADAAANAARAGLLVACLTGAAPANELWTATQDRLHQAHRAPAMPDSYALLEKLRGQGIPAMISGAGPTVLALVRGEGEQEWATQPPAGFRAHPLKIDRAGARVVDEIGNNPAGGTVVRG